MLALTYYERKVLILIAALLLLGACLKIYNISFFKQELPQERSVQSHYTIPINQASVDELTAIPYIGKILARRIVEYREEKGTITTAQELLDIKGIGPKNLETIKQYIIF